MAEIFLKTPFQKEGVGASRITTELLKKEKEITEKMRARNQRVDETAMENLLNGVFYENPNHPVAKKYNELQKQAMKNYKAYLEEIAADFDIQKAISQRRMSKDSNEALLVGKNKGSLKSIMQTIENRLQEIKGMRKNSDLKKIIKDIEKAMSDGDKIVNKMNSYYTNIPLQKNAQKKMSGVTQEDYRDIYDRLVCYSEFLSKAHTGQKAMGDAFEKSLAFFSRVAIREAGYEISERLVKGADTVARGGSKGQITLDKRNLTDEIMRAMAKGAKTTKEELEKAPLSYTETVDGKVVVKYDTGGRRQGKIDVKFLMPEGNNINTYRASAKNWKGASGDLGATRMLYGIDRTLGDHGRDLYIYALVGDMNGEEARGGNMIKTAHRLGQLALLVDIMAGYSQNSGFADTLIINRRDMSKNKIAVFNIYDLFDKVLKNLKKSSDNKTKPSDGIWLSGYDFIQGRKSALDKIKDSTKRSETYKAYILALMAGQKVSVELNTKTLRQ